MKLVVHLEHDPDLTCPNENGDGQWRLYSFCRNHVNYKTPEEFNVVLGRNHVEKVRNIPLANRLRRGLAFWLGYYEHGECAWFRTDNPPVGVEFQWDGVRYAGLLVWEHSPSDMGAKTYEDRAKDADQFLETYTAWANGQGFYYCIEDEEENHIASCGGFYGNEAEYFLKEVALILREREFEIRGSAKYLAVQLRELVEKEKANRTTNTIKN